MLEVKLHDIGEGITEGEIIQFLVQEGEQVTIDQPLVEIQTDKVVAELPSPSTGVVKKIAIPAGEIVQVGTTIMFIETTETSISQTTVVESTVQTNHVDEPKQKEQKNTYVQIIPEENKSSYKRVLATPYTRKIAREHQINLEDVPATDPSGRVTEEDVYRFIQAQETGEQTAPTQDKLAKHLDQTEETIAMSASVPDEIPFQGIRRQIANKMSQSLFTIPHVTVFEEVDMTELFKLREQLKNQASASTSISVTAFLIKALVLALKDFPIFNAELDEENGKIILKKDYHIGLATDTKDGLLVPVLFDAHKKSIQTIHGELKELTAQAQHGKLSANQLKNSTFTVSNVGPLGGGLYATPIINYPETALIAFHQTKKRPVVNEHDEIVIRQIMTLSFVFDHRVADGATAVNFIKQFSRLIEHPYTLMLELI